jgi:hypothetical protein
MVKAFSIPGYEHDKNCSENDEDSESDDEGSENATS